MNALPRAIVLAGIIALAIVPLPFAAASDCVELDTATFANGLHVIANAGRQLALGFQSDTPGDGMSFVVIVTPSVCSGVGLGDGLDLSGLAPEDVEDVLEQTPVYPLLP
ncbi:MAG TPA: hypothetical protein VM370_03655 [Candidatus Thermoplasmatota archaeon]|nr:hypothetical protein [Candidatus Thermoplasmatota archaeon]